MKKREGKKIRVLIADDSSVGRRLLASILSDDPSIEVVAMASDGIEAFEMTIKVAEKAEIVQLNHVAIDGTKIKANASSSNLINKEEIHTNTY